MGSGVTATFRSGRRPYFAFHDKILRRPLRRGWWNCHRKDRHRILPAHSQHSILRRRGPLPFRLLAYSARNAHGPVADARTLGKCNESRTFSGATSTSRARALSRLALASGAPNRAKADVDVWWDAFLRRYRRAQGSDECRRENKSLHSRHQFGWRGKLDRTSRFNRGSRNNFTRRAVAVVDRSRERWRSD